MRSIVRVYWLECSFQTRHVYSVGSSTVGENGPWPGILLYSIYDPPSIKVRYRCFKQVIILFVINSLRHGTRMLFSCLALMTILWTVALSWPRRALVTLDLNFSSFQASISVLFQQLTNVQNSNLVPWAPFRKVRKMTILTISEGSSEDKCWLGRDRYRKCSNTTIYSAATKW
jgi:hypothetical protein